MIPQYCIAHPYCARFSRHYWVRANERVHVHNERSFPQAKLDSEITVLFLLNKHSDIFLSHNRGVHIIILKLKKKLIINVYRTEKGIAESVQNPLLWNGNYYRKNNDFMNALRPRCFKWCAFSTNFMIMFLMLVTLYLSSFFLSITLINYASSYRKI